MLAEMERTGIGWPALAVAEGLCAIFDFANCSFSEEIARLRTMRHQVLPRPEFHRADVQHDVPLSMCAASICLSLPFRRFTHTAPKQLSGASKGKVGIEHIRLNPTLANQWRLK